MTQVKVTAVPHRLEVVHDGGCDGLHEGEHRVDAQRDEHQEEQEGPGGQFLRDKEQHQFTKGAQ